VTDQPSSEFLSTAAAETRAFGTRLAQQLRAGDVVLLHGDLGAGKTTLTQGIAQGLGVTEPVQSPTFTLVAEHLGNTASGDPIRLYHLDLYRLGGENDLEDIGFDDLLAPRDGISVIEWPERAGTWLPERYILVTIEPIREDTRRLTLETGHLGREIAMPPIAPEEE
jgi:tRNA threonylcarbamoyladenosine biosynthesis protein TsaE